MTGHPLRPVTHRCLGEPLPHQLANGTRAHLIAPGCPDFYNAYMHTHSYPVLARLSPSYSSLQGRLLTYYSPVRQCTIPRRIIPLDLHVLSTPPAFVLSQDQTLHTKNLSRNSRISYSLTKLIPILLSRNLNYLLPPMKLSSRAAG